MLWLWFLDRWIDLLEDLLDAVRSKQRSMRAARVFVSSGRVRVVGRDGTLEKLMADAQQGDMIFVPPLPGTDVVTFPSAETIRFMEEGGEED